MCFSCPFGKPLKGYDTIFLDPPYATELGEAALALALAGGWVAPGAMIVWEESTPPVLTGGLTLLDQRKYGGTLVTLARVTSGQP